MKSVLMSIHPKWVEKIVSGEKTMEVRKTRPKLETPFKCYIYETSAKRGRGKVIGEFVCGEIIKDERGEYADVFVKQACLSLEEQKAYGGNKPLYGWHISDLKIYDKPKELSGYRYSSIGYKETVTRPSQSWGYVEVKE